MTMIPQTVHEFMAIRHYYERYPSATMPAYRDCAVRFRLASSYLDARIAEYARYMRQGK